MLDRRRHRPLGVEVCAGVHTGEVAGSGLALEDGGEHELKGVPDRWRLHREEG